ncbi:MAG: ABC transporter permease subunit [Lachnospiraceae bacterium]|nr:ABC transporter permease subunit [Lachnospiraceae bacterium]
MANTKAKKAEQVINAPVSAKKKNSLWYNTKKNMPFVIFALPAFLVLFFIMYVPMGGIIMAFQDFKPMQGFFGSRFVGLENFKFLFTSKDVFYRMTRNTIMYYFIFTLLGTFLNIVLAIALDQFVFKKVGRLMQTVMIVPIFISYAAVQFIVYAFIASDTGLINKVLGTSTSFYAKPGYWIVILTIVKIWNSVGYGSVLYMSVLAGIDTTYYEAAQIDGANKWQQIWHITLPSLVPMITVMLLLSVGNIMRSDTGLFFQVTRDSGALYDTTQVIDSYVLHAIINSPEYGFTAAASLFQSTVGLVMMLIANATVRKISPENSLF